MRPLRLFIPQYKSYELGAIALLTGKTTQHYEYTFQTLKDNINKYKMRPGTFYPINIHVDKENAIIVAIQKAFPINKIRLCYFQFSNNIKKRVHNSIFKDMFNSNSNSLKFIFVCEGLSFIPQIYVILVFELLYKKAKEINNINLINFMDYFAKEWIYGTEISYWNYFKEFEIKTNSASESCNNKINNIFYIKDHLFIMLFMNTEI